MKIKLNLLLFFILILFYGCKKNENPCAALTEKLPNLTSQGNNTFGCKVNGEDWVAYKNIPLFNINNEQKIGTSLNTGNDLLTIIANRDISMEGCDTLNQRMSLSIDSLLAGTPDFLAHTSLINYQESCSYKIDTTKFNNVTITTLDTVNAILSGSFDLQFISNDCNDTILVTEGRFDVIYIPF